MARALISALLVTLSLGWALAAQAVEAGDGHRYVKAGSRAAGLRACVEPTQYMRRHHMDLIQHQRDATVHQGIRGTRHSLAGCIGCHVGLGSDGHPVAVNAEHQFCRACHEFAAVTVNCFDCHDGVPKGGSLSEAAQAALDAATAPTPGQDSAGGSVQRADEGEGQ
jgi:hypothetical protein